MRTSAFLLLSVLACTVGTLPSTGQTRHPASLESARYWCATILLRQFGPATKTISAPNGPMVLIIVNHSPLPSVHISIAQESTDPKIFAQEFLGYDLTVSNHELTVPIDLVPGKYVVSVREKPEWNVALEVRN